MVVFYFCVMRESCVVDQVDVEKARKQLLQWSVNEKYFMLLDSNHFQNIHSDHHAVNWMVAIGAANLFNSSHSLREMNDFLRVKKDWLFGHISYDYKNRLENLKSLNTDFIQFPEITFFQPQCVIIAKKQSLVVSYLPGFQYRKLLGFLNTKVSTDKLTTDKIRIKPTETPAQYENKIRKIKSHIQRGDIYEMNYCTAFFADDVTIQPTVIYQRLCSQAAAPMAVYYKHHHQYLMSGSPERYIKKTGRKLISQPIKGTIKRSEDADEDLHLAKVLENSVKDRTENVMIVDLVRNDLSRVALPGSVNVTELCKPYAFTHWHQLISTIEARISTITSLEDIINATFPMGSMTGAPKIRAMELIEEFEEVKRGIYSGTVGYISPEGNFDFNVVIRSICYNASKKYLSYIVGGAITDASVPKDEYVECLLKAKGIEKALKSDQAC